jgi:hypothetical protein
VDVRVSPRLSIAGYVAGIRGGDVVGRTFADRQLVFGFIESTVQF